jgi:hypothetical protein
MLYRHSDIALARKADSKWYFLAFDDLSKEHVDHLSWRQTQSGENLLGFLFSLLRDPQYQSQSCVDTTPNL